MSVTINGTSGVSLAGQFDSASTFGFKNRLINGSMQIAQRATSATITAGSTIAAGYSTVDRFYVYCTGANVTAAQVAGSGAIKNNLQITGGASVTAIGVGQRIEQLNSYDMAGSTATLSVNLSNSLLTTVTWTAYYATTADTFGTLASPTRTQIATGTFTVTSTLTNYSAQISIPAAATTGIEIVFTVGAQTSGTWVIGNVQLEESSIATSFDYRPYGTELALCQRYFEKSYDQGTAPATNTALGTFNFAGSSEGNGNVIVPIQYSTKRTAPTLTGYLLAGTAGSWNYERSGSSSTGSITFDRTSDRESRAYVVVGANFVVGYVYGHWVASSEL